MIIIDFPQGRYLELTRCYEWKDIIKTLAPAPDVLWDASRKVWRVDARLFDKLASLLGQHFAPIDAEIFLRLPEQGAPPPRKPSHADKQAAAHAGKTILEYARRQR